MICFFNIYPFNFVGSMLSSTILNLISLLGMISYIITTIIEYYGRNDSCIKKKGNQ